MTANADHVARRLRHLESLLMLVSIAEENGSAQALHESTRTEYICLCSDLATEIREEFQALQAGEEANHG